MSSGETNIVDFFDISQFQMDAPNSPCEIYGCDNPHTQTITVHLDNKEGSIDICEECKQKHIKVALVYFFFVDEKGLDIKIIYFQDDEELDRQDTGWEYVCEHFFADLYRYRKEPEGGLL